MTKSQSTLADSYAARVAAIQRDLDSLARDVSDARCAEADLAWTLLGLANATISKIRPAHWRAMAERQRPEAKEARS